MQTHYQLNMDDIMSMSWRRFSVLFFSVFSHTDKDDEAEGSLPAEYGSGGSKRSHYEQVVHEAAGASGEIQRSFDWDAAHGRSGPESRAIITTTELLKNSGSGETVET